MHTIVEIECNLSFIILERLQKTRGVPIPPEDVPKGCGGSDEETEGETEAAFDMSLDEGIVCNKATRIFLYLVSEVKTVETVDYAYTCINALCIIILAIYVLID